MTDFVEVGPGLLSGRRRYEADDGSQETENTNGNADTGRGREVVYFLSEVSFLIRKSRNLQGQSHSAAEQQAPAHSVNGLIASRK